MRIDLDYKDNTIDAREFIDSVQNRIIENGKFDEEDLKSCVMQMVYNTGKCNLLQMINKPRGKYLNIKFSMDEWRSITALLNSCNSNICLYDFIYEPLDVRMRKIYFTPGDEELFFELFKHVANDAEVRLGEIEKRMYAVMRYMLKVGFNYLRHDVKRYALMRFGHEGKINF